MSEAQGNKSQVRWYLTPAAILAAVLIAGPFAIPLVWMSPAFKKRQKALITALLILLTIWLVKVSADLYGSLFRQLQQLQEMMRR